MIKNGNITQMSSVGSMAYVAHANGSLKQELSYDAWGRLRNPATQVVYPPGTELALFLGRGYPDSLTRFSENCLHVFVTQ